jgi:RNA polymerase sigma-70 factor (ECF subfamily)
MRELTDEQLVAQVQEGDVLAFETLVKRYQRKLYGFVQHMVKNPLATDDIVQESFINLYKTIDRVDTKKKLSSYVFAIARNTTISHIRKYKKEIPLDEVLLSDEEEKIYASIAAAEQSRTITHALDQIASAYKKVIQLYYFDDLSYEQISKKLHVPVNTVRTHLRRGKEALKALLQYEKN